MENGHSQDSDPEKKKVCVVIPVYNEAEAIPLFVKATIPELEKSGVDYRLLFIDDGSTDGSLQAILEEKDRCPRISLVSLSRNFGKEAALTAGLDHASGDAVIVMDVDLQDPPELIPTFIAKWREGNQVVYGIRRERRQDSLFKRASAALFYRVIGKLSNQAVPKNVGDFRLMDIKVVEKVRQMREHNRFSKGIFAYTGFRAAGVEYNRPARSRGKTKWGIGGLWTLAINGIISFSSTPLKVWSYIGLCFSLFSLVYMLILLLGTMMHGRDVPGYASIMVSILFLGGLQLISLGIIGEYIARIFDEVKNRPIYIVESKYE